MNVKELWKKYKGLFLYLVFGVVTTLVNIVTYHLCYEVAHIPNTVSTVIAWVLSVAVAYITNKLWVFDSKSFAPEVLLPEVWKFVSCRLATGLLDLGIMVVFVDVLHYPGTPVKLLSNVVVVVLNYVFSKLVIFKGDKAES